MTIFKKKNRNNKAIYINYSLRTLKTTWNRGCQSTEIMTVEIKKRKTTIKTKMRFPERLNTSKTKMTHDK